jgi:hypothetical protein
MILVLNLLVIYPALPHSGDSASVDQTRKEPRFPLSVSGIYAILETNVRFESLNGMLGLKIGMEDHLRLDKYRVMPLLARGSILKTGTLFMECITTSRARVAL